MAISLALGLKRTFMAVLSNLTLFWAQAVLCVALMVVATVG